MTDKPMDVERTLRELETKWRKLSAELDEETGTDGGDIAMCADELKAVREALREPGAMLSEEQVYKSVVESTPVPMPHNVNIKKLTEHLNAALSSKQEPPAPARVKGQCHSLSACLCCYKLEPAGKRGKR
jgi:hypothetical protein